MNFTFAHNNLNVYDLEKSLDFYQKALNLKVEREKLADDESFKLVYLTHRLYPGQCQQKAGRAGHPVQDGHGG